MDLYGVAPSRNEGRYFRAETEEWERLTDVCQIVDPGAPRQRQHWRLNEGNGLDEGGAMALAAALKKPLDRDLVFTHFEALGPYGRLIQYLTEWNKEGETLDTLRESHPEGMTSREIAAAVIAWHERASETIRTFTGFLEYCGGFEIW